LERFQIGFYMPIPRLFHARYVQRSTFPHEQLTGCSYVEITYDNGAKHSVDYYLTESGPEGVPYLETFSM
jgi:hypothetical protein